METSKKILIIDDDIDFQLMVGNRLRMSGYEVKSQLEGKTDEASAVARECDLVLLDIGLPGISGVVISKELKLSPLTIDVPIILVSAQQECDHLLAESLANALIHKPFSFSGLMNKIQELLSIKEKATLQ